MRFGWIRGLIKVFLRKNDVVTIAGRIVHESKKAILFEYDSRNAWLPRRKIKILKQKDSEATIQLPGWLAERKFNY